MTSADRIQNFKLDIIDGPNFVCCSCNRELFKTGVRFLDFDDINALMVKHSLELEFFKEVGLDGLEDLILCHGCLTNIKKEKIPSINVQNGSSLEDIPKELELGDLEQQLIARSLMFIKVCKLPKSGMRAMKDEVINVPIENEDISKSITTLPRHPDDAHLVAVQLKRKVEYKNSHLEGFIRPNVIIKALKTLKERGNRFYQDIKINENFMENNEIPPMEMDVDDAESQRIEREEDEAWEMNKKQEDELKAKLGLEAEEGDSDNEFDTVLKSVKKFQSNQTNYTFLIPDDMATEVVVNTGNSTITKPLKEGKESVKIAPGEGKIPTSLLREEHFDVRAFPKHHPNGQYGVHHSRKQKLTNHKYFNQQLMNEDERFSKDPCYLFMACYYLERQSIENQINISGKNLTSSICHKNCPHIIFHFFTHQVSRVYQKKILVGPGRSI